jgi:hypothetical protein
MLRRHASHHRRPLQSPHLVSPCTALGRLDYRHIGLKELLSQDKTPGSHHDNGILTILEPSHSGTRDHRSHSAHSGTDT